MNHACTSLFVHIFHCNFIGTLVWIDGRMDFGWVCLHLCACLAVADDRANAYGVYALYASWKRDQIEFYGLAADTKVKINSAWH